MRPDTVSIRPCIFSDEVAPDFEESVRLSAEAGAQGLELRGRMFGRSIGQIDDDDVARIREICERHGVRVAVIGSPVGKCSMDDPEELRQHQRLFERMAQLAHAFGTPLIRAFALWKPGRERTADHDRPDIDRFLPSIRAFMEPILRTAERENVRFCLETEGATLVGTCAEARRLIDAVGAPAELGVAWDVNNGLACGESPCPEGYSLIRDRIYHLHVKPNRAKSLATVGESTLTYEAVIEILKRDGYAGWASIEHWGTPDDMLKGLRELVPVLDRVNELRT
jgi:sugar phosphate isomerase/epimerase